MGSRTRIAVIAVAALVACAAPAASRAAGRDAVWIHELESDEKLMGQEVTVEGRFSGIVGANRDQVKLHGSKVEFHLPDDIAKQPPRNMKFVRMSGILMKSSGKLVLKVKSLEKITDTDSDRYNAAASNIGAKDFRAWDVLAERTQGLADFYNDAELKTELKSLAAAARLKAFQAREAALQPTEIDALLKLAGEASKVGLNESESRRMRHKALRWRFDAITARDATAAEWAQFADELAKLLPGTVGRIRSTDSAAIDRYRAAPIIAYDREPVARDLFDRDFWVTVTSRRLVTASTESGANRFALSNQAKELMPDRLDVWRQLLESWVDAEAAKIGTLPDSQVRALAAIIHGDLGHADRAAAVLRQWLDLRRRKLGARDAEGRCDLARDYRADLKDDVTAKQLLLEAVDIQPDLARAGEALKALGVVKEKDGKWVSVAAAPDRDAVARSTATGRLPQVGMSADEVRELLGEPKPDNIARLGANRQVTEQWVYRDPRFDLYVTFRLDSNKVARVAAVKQAKK